MKESDAIRNIMRTDPKTAELLRDLLEAGHLKSIDNPPTDDCELVVVCAAWPSALCDSVQASCERCGTSVAVALSTRKILEKRKGPSTIHCLPCAAAHAEENRDHER